MTKLTYWYVECHKSHEFMSIIAKTKKEALDQLHKYGSEAYTDDSLPESIIVLEKREMEDTYICQDCENEQNDIEVCDYCESDSLINVKYYEKKRIL